VTIASMPEGALAHPRGRRKHAPHPPPLPVHWGGPEYRLLAQCHVELDEKGFVRTGTEIEAGRHPLETNRRGVFAIGDVRSGSVKRVAAAVGEGAQVVAALHAYLGVGERAAQPTLHRRE
jgi:thioredoxin reductase (NADPH)